MGIRTLISSWTFSLYDKLNSFLNPTHMLDMRTPEYKGGEIDTESLMLYANFNLLCRFIEIERGQNILWVKEGASPTIEDARELCGVDKNDSSWDLTPAILSVYKDLVNHYNARKEIKALYLWWAIDRRLKWGEFNVKIGSFDELFEAEVRLRQKDQDMLQRLIAVRSFLYA